MKTPERLMRVTLLMFVLSACTGCSQGRENEAVSLAPQVHAAEVSPPAAGSLTTPPAKPAPAVASPPIAEARTIVVAIDGAVQKPGAYRVPESERVDQLIMRAGGTTAEADLSGINIAAYAVDATTLVIPVRPQSGRPVYTAAQLNPPCYTRSGWQPPAEQAPTQAPLAIAASDQSALTQAGQLINLNTASQAELETLPGVGEKTAEKILAYRARQPFRQVDDLNNIAGIGEKRLEAIRPFVTAP